MNHRYLAVKLNFTGRSLPALVEQAQKAIAARVKIDPSRYRLQWSGDFESEQRAEARLILILGLILGLMIVLLFAQFGAFRQVALILRGGAARNAGGPDSAPCHRRDPERRVSGRVHRAVRRCRDEWRDHGGQSEPAPVLRLPLNEAVIAGASERLRPVLMTATVATVGMLPAALATGVGSDVQRSLATVVAGGLLMATLLTLFVIPTYYFVIERFMDARERRRRITELTAESRPKSYIRLRL